MYSYLALALRSSLPYPAGAVVWWCGLFQGYICPAPHSLSPHGSGGLISLLAVLVELSRNLFLGSCWRGRAAPHKIMFSQGVPGLSPRKGDFSFWLGLCWRSEPSPQVCHREGPAWDMGSKQTNRVNMTFYNGALICLMSQDRLGTDARLG